MEPRIGDRSTTRSQTPAASHIWSDVKTQCRPRGDKLLGYEKWHFWAPLPGRERYRCRIGAGHCAGDSAWRMWMACRLKKISYSSAGAREGLPLR